MSTVLKIVRGPRQRESMPEWVIGKEVRIVAVGDAGRFASGQEGARVEFLDGSVKYEGGRPVGSFFIDEFNDRSQAINEASGIASDWVRVIDCERGEIYTNRGPIRLDVIHYADGGKSPVMPESILDLIRNDLIECLKAGVTLF